MLGGMKHEFSIFPDDPPEFLYGLSTQRDGPMNIKVEGGLSLQTALNRSTFLNQRGYLIGDYVVNPQQQHGYHVTVIQLPCALIQSPHADGLFTKSLRVWLTVRTADCR